MELKILAALMALIAFASAVVLYRAFDPRRKPKQEHDAHLPLEGDDEDEE